MKSPTFDIKIAFCGYVNSGKSTLVNALLQNKYSEVSMDRRTVSVNSFRIFANKDKTANDSDDFDSISSNSNKENDDKLGTTWAVVPEKLFAASEAYTYIAEINSVARETSEIEEFEFDIEVPETICDMREDTKLVIIDLPGLPAEKCDLWHRSYLCANWNTYDCVVVVLDVTESLDLQLKLINFMKESLKVNKEISVIFVCNKVDSPYDPEINTKLEALESAANLIFAENEFNFSFVSLCAKDAFFYRASLGLPVEQFQSLDMEWIEKIGIDEVSRSTWRQLSSKEKYDVAYKALCNKVVLEESLSNTNFPKFLTALQKAVGGSNVQLKLIQKQLAVALEDVEIFDETTVATISKIKCITEHLGIPTDMSFNDRFWVTYRNYLTGAIETYKVNTDHKVFHVAISQLIAYHGELGQSGLNEVERRKVLEEMISLMRLQLTELLKYAESWQDRYMANKATIDSFAFFNGEGWFRIHDGADYESHSYTEPYGDFGHYWKRVGFESWKNKYTEEVKNSKCNPVTLQEDWFDLSMRDFEIAFASILLASSSKAFCLHFGREKMRIESLMRKFDALQELYSISCPESMQFRCMFECMKGKYDDLGEFIPDHRDKYDIFVHFHMPEQISDPEHWGHLAWKFCEFMEKTSN